MDFLTIFLSVCVGMGIEETVSQLARVFRNKNATFQLSQIVETAKVAVVVPAPSKINATAPREQAGADLWVGLKNG